MILLVAAMSCPIVGLDGRTLHRVDVDGLPLHGWANAETATARCGLTVKLLPGDSTGSLPVRWVDIRTRGTGYTRCPECKVPRARPS